MIHCSDGFPFEFNVQRRGHGCAALENEEIPRVGGSSFVQFPVLPLSLFPLIYFPNRRITQL